MSREKMQKDEGWRDGCTEGQKDRQRNGNEMGI